MEILNEIQSSKRPLVKSTPSLLRQIMDEVDELDTAKKEVLLWEIKMEKALALAKEADETYKDKFLPLTDDQIVSLVSTNRKADYDAKVHH